ncbi:MAG: hypothetical protein HC828_07565 [Blastochloris sp.]|nr:hypothetical protein [Blastochloris sp.]
MERPPRSLLSGLMVITALSALAVTVLIVFLDQRCYSRQADGLIYPGAQETTSSTTSCAHSAWGGRKRATLRPTA